MLGLGPHVGKIGDDLFPPVRVLGAMQIVLAMGIGAGALIIGKQLWELVGRWPSYAYGSRTALAAIAAALVVLVALPGGAGARAARARARRLRQQSQRDEMLEISRAARQAARRPQAGRARAPRTTGGTCCRTRTTACRRCSRWAAAACRRARTTTFCGRNRDYVKNAWIYDAPYVVFAKAMGSKMPLGETVGGTDTYEIRKLPTAGLVSPVQVTGTLPPGYDNGEPGHKAALDWVKTDAPLKDEVLAYAGSGGAGPEPHGKTLRAWHQPSPGSEADIVAEVEADAPTTFVIRESWHPRWHAYVDGNEVPVRRVTPDFSAVDVTAGKHTIEMRFERPWWALAVWLLWPGTALAAWLVTRRKKPPKPDLAEARAIRTAA